MGTLCRIVFSCLIATVMVAFASACGEGESTETPPREAHAEATTPGDGPRASARTDDRADQRRDARKRDVTAQGKRQEEQAEPSQEAVEQQTDAAQKAEKQEASTKKKPKGLSPEAKKQKQLEEREPKPEPRAYKVAYEYCAEHSPRELAREYGESPRDYEGIAQAHAEETANERSLQAAYAGCYDALVEEWG